MEVLDSTSSSVQCISPTWSELELIHAEAHWASQKQPWIYLQSDHQVNHFNNITNPNFLGTKNWGTWSMWSFPFFESPRTSMIDPETAVDSETIARTMKSSASNKGS